LRWLEAIAIFAGSFFLAAIVVYNRAAVQDYLWSVGWPAYPIAILLMTIVASAPFSVTDALAVMNGIIFGPLVGSIINAVGIVFAAILAYFLALRTSKLLDIAERVERLPGWIKRWPVASPMFLVLVRILPGIGGTVATQTAAAYRIPVWTQVWTMSVVAIPICTLLAVFGDSVADYVHAHVTTPVKTYVIEHSRRIHFPRLHRQTPGPTATPELKP
jgi:uncharacterized membrane protein YdjX (TVP38/TMEM64 family)